MAGIVPANLELEEILAEIMGDSRGFVHHKKIVFKIICAPPCAPSKKACRESTCSIFPTAILNYALTQISLTRSTWNFAIWSQRRKSNPRRPDLSPQPHRPSAPSDRMELSSHDGNQVALSFLQWAITDETISKSYTTPD